MVEKSKWRIFTRNNTFINAEGHNDGMYVQWPNKNNKHETQYYPGFNIFCYPKKYQMGNKPVFPFDTNFARFMDAYGVF